MAHYRIIDASALIEFVLGMLNCRRCRKPSRKGARPLVELLEDRTVPATFVVNTLADTHAVDLVAGVDSAGLVSLRSAVEAANHLGGDQTIQFDANIFASPQAIVLTQGVLDLKDVGPGAITIVGPDGGITVSGNHASGVFRVEPKTTAELSNLTILAGRITGDGGGIYNAGTLSLRNCTVTGNTAIIYSVAKGIGIYCYFGSGGGICNKGSLTISDSTISGNTAQWDGAGLYNARSGMIDIKNSIISGNTKIASRYIYSGYGGGIDNLGTANIANSTISGNSTTAEGGGVYNNGTVDLLDCTISGNTSGSYGGGVCGTDGATTDLDRCTISGNSAWWAGGGVAIPTPYTGDAEPLSLDDCTISGNNASHLGGGVFIGSGNEATVTNCTISGNTAPNGGGFYNDNEQTSVSNTIIAGNSSKIGNNDLVGFFLPNSVNNLIGDGSGLMGGIRNNVKGNQVGTHTAPINPLLAPLGYYGGFTQTMPLLAGSLAIDAGSNAVIPAGSLTDQRGQPRVVNGVVDIGAVESPLAFLSAPTNLKPTDLLAPGGSYDKPTFTWNAVDGADHYHLVVRDNSTGQSVVDVSNINGVSYTSSSADALTPGHSFTTYVVALNSDSTEYGGAAENFELAALPAPTDLTPSGAIPASAGYDRPIFSWNDTGADHYSLKVVDNTTHTAPILVSNISDTSYVTSVAQTLTPGHSFVMYVTAFSTNGNAMSVAMQSFTLAKLAAPTSITPAGVVAASAGYDSPIFNWSAVDGADHYNLTVIDNSTGLAAINVSNLHDALYATTLAQALTPGHRFTTHVYACSANGKTYSSGTQTFWLAALSAPTGITPSGLSAAGAGFDQPAFAWNVVAGADHYNLTVVDNTIGAAAITVRNLRDTSYVTTLAQALTPGHRFTIHVYAVSTNGKASSTGSQSFALAALTPPTLLSPIDAAVASPPTFAWTVVAGADHYDFYLMDNTARGTAVRYANIPGSSFAPPTPLVVGHKYTWWIAAVSTNGHSAVRSKSLAFTFTGTPPGT